ncbi:hypothetical protein PAXRUDRAFT_805996 [Paxillus rubicundulus Ve08.2h10]|uniref:Unplaced genomic scaffold scaffold_88, whole genome shotgun sequence n=1 Tax=Paxillus rubicundulus Ve08.2h10 TaxID=930991 RepID=A0A0D0E256_9AGAM|nr:hypothetical protein PAXRUDRAFT_805996 [Paxillus rubicundulus Ve08.2h10]
MTGHKIFTGSLQSKKKNELQDIAFALQLPIDGTKDDTVTRIWTHLDKNQQLELDSQFMGLYPSHSCQATVELRPSCQPPATSAVEIPPVPSRWNIFCHHLCHFPPQHPAPIIIVYAHFSIRQL